MTTTQTPLIVSAIVETTGINSADAQEDVLGVNEQQDIIAAGASLIEKVKLYVQVKQIKIKENIYKTNAYIPALEQTTKGVI